MPLQPAALGLDTGLAIKRCWYLPRDIALYLSYSSPGILGMLQKAPKMSGFWANQVEG